MNSRGDSYRFWAIVKRNQIAILGCLLVLLAASVGWNFYASDAHSATAWNSAAVTATYVGAQLRELDSSQAALFLAYDLNNNTRSDYRFADGPGVVIMSRLQPDGNLSSQEQMRLSYPTLLPAGQRARIAIEIVHPFAWPADNDSQMQQKLKAFVNQRVASVEQFVLFDQADHIQVNFPAGWQQLKVATASVAPSK